MKKNFTIGNWTIDPSHNLIKNSHQEVKLEPQAMAVLCYLAGKIEQPVSIAELIEVIWKNKVVTDHVVYKTMTRLRKALASDERQQNYIKTISKKGYLLTFPVEGFENNTSSVSDEQGTNLPSKDEVFPEESKNSQALPLSSVQKLIKQVKNYSLLSGLSLILLVAVIVWFSGIDAYWHSLNQKIYNKVSRLAQLEDIEYLPVLSHDSKYLLVSSHNDLALPKRTLKIIHLESHETYPLTDSKYDYGDYAWSSSGESIIASRFEGSQITNPNCNLVLIELNEDLTAATSEVELTKCSPDSSDADYDDIANIVYFNYAEKLVGPSHIYSINPVNLRINQLTASKEPGFGDMALELSPDRKKIAFMRVSESRGKHVLMLYDLEKSEERELFELPSFYNELSWTPDSQSIIYQASRSEVILYSLEYDYHKSVVSNIGQLNEPRHSRGEDSIVTVRYIDSNDIYRSDNLNDFTAKNDEMLVTSGGRDLFPAFANQSYKFSYNSNRGGPWQIWVRDEQGVERKITSLTDNGFPGKTLWSPDDSQIIAAYDGKIILIDVEEASHQVIFQDEELLAVNLAWAADGKSIYFNGNKGAESQIYQLDLQINTWKKITERGGFDLAASPDGKYLYLLKFHQEGLWQFDLKTKAEKKVFDKADSNSVWSVKAIGSNVYLTYFDGYGYIYKYNALSGQTELVSKSSEIELGMNISFDEKYILWNQMRVLESSLNKHRP